MARAEEAQEGWVGGVSEPALGDKGGADEGGWEAKVEQDLMEDVVIAEDCRYDGLRCR